jgi:DNA-binding LacI/PurR family transcriptional regulator
MATTRFSKQRGKELVDYYSKYAHADGIILIDGASAYDSNSHIPIVCIGSAPAESIKIASNKTAAFTEAIDYFISKGVRDIGFLGERLTFSKENMFRSIISDKLGAVNEDYIISGERFSDGGYDTAKKLIETGKLPRALICAYDYLAIGAIRCFTEHGYRVPEDIAVMGMDDIPEAKYLNPPLSSINANNDLICDTAARLLVDIIMGKPHEETAAIDSTLILRSSTRIDD